MAESGDLTKARRQITDLRRRTPDFKPLLALAWEIEDLANNSMAAAARAYDWLHASPNSTTAAEALHRSASKAGMPALALRAARQLQQDQAGLSPSIEPFDTPFGPLNFEQACAVDLSRMHLSDGNFDAAETVLRDMDHPSARNNRAIALFSAGRIQQAQELIEANWQAEPSNLFALERVARWRCWRWGLPSAAGLSAPLLHTDAKRPEDATARVHGLLFLRQWDGADHAWQSSVNEAFWDFVRPEHRAEFHYAGAVAALQSAQMEEALQRLRIALEADPAHQPSIDLQVSLVSGNHSHEIQVSDLWFAQAWLDRATKLRDLAPALQESEFDALCDACDAHADYLGWVAEMGGSTMRALALAILQRRARQRNEAAVAQLQQLLKLPCGPDAVRMRLYSWLRDQELIAVGQTLQIWMQGKLRDTDFQRIEIDQEPRPSPFPAKGAALYEQIHAAIGRSHLHKAQDMAKQLLKMYPQEPMALGVLAAIKEGLQHPQHEVTALYQQAYAVDPTYLFALCGLARAYIHDGLFEKARALLKERVLNRTKFHFSEYRSVLLTQRALALATGEPTAGADRALTDLESEFGQ